MQHITRYKEAYLTLLVPNASDPQVAQLLHMISLWIGHESAPQDAAAALNHLQLLTSIVQHFNTANGSGPSDQDIQRLTEGQAELLACICTSLVDTTAVIEVSTRKQLADKAASSQRAKHLSPEKVQQLLEQQIRYVTNWSAMIRAAPLESKHLTKLHASYTEFPCQLVPSWLQSSAAMS
jgi:hypothetical protein